MNGHDNNFPIVSIGSIGGDTLQTVNARDLHAYLKVGKVFATWLTDRIEQYGFAENVDYEVFPEIGNNPRGGRPTKEYAISIDMAKELSMVERNEQGRRVRKYFIECERRARAANEAVAVPTTAEAFANAFLMIAQAEKVQAEHTKAIARIEEKVQRVEVAQTVLRSRPANAENITRIRNRMNKRHGLSGSIIEEVLHQLPYSPKPAGMVRNDHVNADGALYAVYWQKDVTKTFDRFVEECVAVTPFMHTHPFIEGRFRVARKQVVA